MTVEDANETIVTKEIVESILANLVVRKQNLSMLFSKSIMEDLYSCGVRIFIKPYKYLLIYLGKVNMV